MNRKGMLSGSVLGAILRAYSLSKRERWQESYKDLAIIAAVWAGIIMVISFLMLFFGTTIIGDVLEWLPESVTGGITDGLSLTFIGSFLFGIYAYVSMFVGALIIDIAIKIKESI